MFRNIFITGIFLLIAILSCGQFPNVMVGNSNFPDEPSIIINPREPGQMVAGANLRTYYYSGDGGWTWQEGILNSPFGVWGDPCVLVDTNGHFYYFHLSNPLQGNWIDRIVCQKSINGGETWSGGTYMGLNGAKAQDKEWAVIDPSNNNIYVTWTQFDHYGSSNPLDSSVILFSRSADGGQTWSDARRLNKVAGDCLDEDNTVEGAVPAVGPNGEIYVSWAGPLGLLSTKSLDHGQTWPDSNIYVSSIPGGWDYTIPGIYRANGLPVTCCDLSYSPYRGHIYINWSDQRNGITDTDVWFARSTDGGNTWSQPKRVNDDPAGKHQFFTWMTVDPVTGYIYCVFYDRRNHENNLTDVYLAISGNGGETFENIKISNSPFDPNTAIFFGDYTNISAYNNIVRPIWTRLDNYDISIWTAIIDSLNVGMDKRLEIPVPFSLDQNYPNPATDFTCISYKVHEPSRISLKVYDVFGREIATILKDKHVDTGKHAEYFNISDHNLSPGFYYFTLTSGDQTLERKMIVK